MSIAFTTRGANYIDAGSGSSIDNLTALTYLGWVYLTDVSPNDYGLFGIGTFAGQMRKDFGLDSAGVNLDTTDFVVDCSVTDARANTTSFVYSADTWYFVAVTWAGVGNNPQIWRGDMATVIAEAGAYATQAAGAGAVNSSAASSFRVGNIGNSDRSMIGRIGHAQVYNRALSLAELRSIQFRPRNLSGCVLSYWPFSTTSVVDFSGAGNTGTPANASLAAGPPLGPWFGADSEETYVVAAPTGDLLLRMMGEGLYAGSGSYA